MEAPKPEPLIFVIFGASGDLAKRKLIPAIFDLFNRKYLPKDFAILGVSRSPLTDDEFHQQVFFDNEFIDLTKVSEEVGFSFTKRLSYQSIDTSNEADYAKLKDRLNATEIEFGTLGNCIFYLSTPPVLYETIPACLAAHGLNKHAVGFRRLVVEKPFGYDLESARKLNVGLKKYFNEDDIYRIDHYLGKETVQNLLVTRFANGIFEPLWNRNYIHHVEITSAENIGVGNRGGYYDHSGALRDMVQNHLMQLVSHVAMEPPVASDAASIRVEKSKLFKSLRPIASEKVGTDVVRGQYLGSAVRGEKLNGYREEQDVALNSKTETFVALKFFIDNWRWSDVPFYVRAGKRLPTRVAEITITFNKPPHTLFRREAELFNKPNNRLVIRIQPDEGLLLNFGMKVPGEGLRAKNVSMDFRYSDLSDTDVPEAYERLLLDCMNGDATLFAHGDSVEYSWQFVEPILDAWENDSGIPIYGYPAGSWGPEPAEHLIQPQEMGWRNPCRSLTDENSFCEL